MSRRIASCSVPGILSQTDGLGTHSISSSRPPLNLEDSLEKPAEFLKGVCREEGRLGPGCRAQVRAVDRDVDVLAEADFDLAVAAIAWEAGQTDQFQGASEERVAGIGDLDLPFALFGN